MHYLDPGVVRASAPVTPPPAEPTELPPALLKYQEYLATGGARGLSEWMDTPGVALPPLPACLYSRRSRGRSRTPIADVLSGTRHSEQDKRMVREVIAVMRTIDGYTEDEVVAPRNPPPAARRRLNFQDEGESSGSSEPVRDASPVAVAMDEADPPAVGLEPLAARIGAVLNAPGADFTMPYQLCEALAPDEFFSGDAFIAALACELMLIGATYSIPLAPATNAIVGAAASETPYARAQREWEGRHMYERALARCARGKKTVRVRDVALHIVALRPPFAQAAAAHVLDIVSDRNTRVLAWICAAAPYGGLRPVWTDMHVAPTRKSFVPPYVTPATLAEAPKRMSQFRYGGGLDMTDREAATFIRLLAHALAVCTEYDPTSLAAARAQSGYFISQEDIDAYARVWDAVAMYAAEHPDLGDSYVPPATTNWAIEFLDARQDSRPGRRGPAWFTFVRVTAAIERAVADTPAAMFQQRNESLFLDETHRGVECPHTVAAFTPAQLCDVAVEFARLVDGYAIMCVQGAKDARTVAIIGQFMCALREVLRRGAPVPSRHGGSSDVITHTKTVLACMREVHVQNATLDTPHFVHAVAHTVRGARLVDTFFDLWDLWLPRFAEAALSTAARTAVLDPAFDARAQVQSVEPGSPLHEFLLSP